MKIPEVHQTLSSTRYLKDPGVILLAKTIVCDPNTNGLDAFLLGLDPEFHWSLKDYSDHAASGADLVQIAGQLCYLSFGSKRTPMSKNKEYLRKVIESKHGSVTEHANYTLLFYGIDRACTHELVRHRAGMAYSQVSQRFVDGTHLRFVMPYEYQSQADLVQAFESSIDHASNEYEKRTEELKKIFPKRADEFSTEWRKRIQSCARECLPNSTEAPIVVTGNARAWRHVLFTRCSKHADVRIRRPMIRALQVLQETDINLFDDFQTSALPDGSICATALFEKP